MCLSAECVTVCGFYVGRNVVKGNAAYMDFPSVEARSSFSHEDGKINTDEATMNAQAALMSLDSGGLLPVYFVFHSKRP